MTTDLLNIAGRIADRAMTTEPAPFQSTIPANIFGREIVVTTFHTDGENPARLHNERVVSLYTGQSIHYFTRPDGTDVVCGVRDGMLTRTFPLRMTDAEYALFTASLDANAIRAHKFSIWAGNYDDSALWAVVAHLRESRKSNITPTDDAPVVAPIVISNGKAGRNAKVYPHITPDTTTATLGRALTAAEASYRTRIRKASGWTPAKSANVKGAESLAHSQARQSRNFKAATADSSR